VYENECFFFHFVLFFPRKNVNLKKNKKKHFNTFNHLNLWSSDSQRALYVPKRTQGVLFCDKRLFRKTRKFSLRFTQPVRTKDLVNMYAKRFMFTDIPLLKILPLFKVINGKLR